jgi:hypothetical protein
VKRSGLYPRVQADARGFGVVSQAGGVALVETIRVAGLDRALSAALAPWRKPLAIHDPGKVIIDLAVALALGGDCLADIALLRGEPGVFGLVASDSTVSRMIDMLIADVPHALAAIDAARAAARAQVWRVAGEHAPDHGVDAARPLIIDDDATLITSHSEKECAAPTFKRGFGFHPIWTFADHGGDGTGEPLAVLLRPGNAGSNTAADHIAVIKAALTQLPGHRRGRGPGRTILIRTDAAGATHELLNWLTRQRLSYSVGFTLPDSFAATLALIPRPGVDPGLRRRQTDPRRGLGRRRDRPAEPVVLAEGDAGDRAQGTAAPRRATAPDRHRRTPHHRVRDQHTTGTAGRPRAAAPPPSPLRRPHPQRQRHRADQSATA